MKKIYYSVYPASLILFLIPYVPISIKGIFGFVFILTSCISVGLKPAMATATLCVVLATYNLYFNINLDVKFKYLSVILGTLLYYLLAYTFGQTIDKARARERGLLEEIERRRDAEKELGDRLSRLESLTQGSSQSPSQSPTQGPMQGPTDTIPIPAYFKDMNGRILSCNHAFAQYANIEEEGLQRSIVESRHIMEEMLENDRIKTEFFSHMSHEFRTPLNVILGSLQLMELYLTADQYAVSRDKVIKRVAVLKKNSYRLLRLANNLIDLSRIEAKSFEMNFRNCDVVDLIRSITLSVSEYTLNEGITVTFETDIPSRTMACDDEKIERILLNLLSNAVKFTPRGGKISVGISGSPDGLHIKVEDNGIGIPAEKQSRIFQRFCQIDCIFTRQHEGSGIGLSLVKSLVEMHGGTIHFVSEDGQGTSFTIFLPYNEADEEALRYKVIREPGYTNRISVEFSDIYSIGKK
jgi:signal transduction histidine kinase